MQATIIREQQETIASQQRTIQELTKQVAEARSMSEDDEAKLLRSLSRIDPQMRLAVLIERYGRPMVVERPKEKEKEETGVRYGDEAQLR